MDDHIKHAWAALAEVMDPEAEIDVVALGLVRAVEPEGVALKVTMTLTHPACPAGELILEEVEDALAPLPVPARVELTFDPPWTPDCITEDGRRQLAGRG